MERTTTTATIRRLNELFAQFGVPEVLVSDNETQFTSNEFAEFCKQNAIKHLRSPPGHPQSNSQVERFVDIFKRALCKMKGTGTTQELLQIFLMMYRATPNPALENCLTPAEMLMNRKLRLPYDIIRPTVTTNHMKNMTMENKFNKQHGAKLRFFKPGDRVIVTMYNGKLTWKHGTIWKMRGKVVYEVLVDNHIIIRHANQIRKGVNSNTQTSTN